MNTESHNDDFLHFVSTKQNQNDGSNKVGNGLILQNTYLPEEVVLQILSHIDPEQLLNYTLVCRNWNRLIKSCGLWSIVYERKIKKKPKKLPWYLYYCLLSTNYFNTNLLQNKEKVTFWTYRRSEPSTVTLRDLDLETDNVFVLIIKTLLNIGDEEGWPGTSYARRMKFSPNQQCLIKLGKSKLFKHILDVYKPHICLSECGHMDILECGFLGKDMTKDCVNNCSCTLPVKCSSAAERLIITEYPEGIEGILFKGIRDENYRFEDLYGNSSVILLFESIEPLTEENKEKLKTSNIQIITKS